MNVYCIIQYFFRVEYCNKLLNNKNYLLVLKLDQDQNKFFHKTIFCDFCKSRKIRNAINHTYYSIFTTQSKCRVATRNQAFLKRVVLDL